MPGYDEAGALAGIDIDNAGEKVQLKELFLKNLPPNIHSAAA